MKGLFGQLLVLVGSLLAGVVSVAVAGFAGHLLAPLPQSIELLNLQSLAAQSSSLPVLFLLLVGIGELLGSFMLVILARLYTNAKYVCYVSGALFAGIIVAALLLVSPPSWFIIFSLLGVVAGMWSAFVLTKKPDPVYMHCP